MPGFIQQPFFALCFFVLASGALIPSAFATEIELIDDNGRAVLLKEPAHRVITLSPHITELVFAAGGGDKIVATVTSSDFPIPARNLPRIGDGLQPDPEKIAAYRPDLLIGWLAEQADPMAALNIPVFISAPQSLAEIADSVETFGTVDGPGIRFIVFTSGCRLRCQYCHNPDTWKMDDGKLTSTDELIKDILRYKTYMKSTGGGVTISGGEPLLQPAFVKELIDKLHQNDLTVAIDTCGFPDINDNNVKETVDAADLILLDIKSINPNLSDVDISSLNI